jgi:Mce-associated membrane protein
MSNDDAGSKNPESDKEGGVEDTTATETTAENSPETDDKTIDLGKSSAEPATDAPAADKDAAAAKSAEPAQDSAGDAPKGRRFGLVPVISAFVAGILLVAAVTAVVVFYLQATDRGDKLAAQADATKAACEYGRLISTYDPQTIDDYLKKVDAASTGDWKDTFSKIGQDLKGVVVDAKAKSSTYDMQCGFQSGDKNNATVLVVIGQTTTNVNIAAANKPPSQVELVVVAGLEKQGDKWLVNKFDLPILKQLGNN